MAKSLRSKWKRKCRAVKRERYGVKELERLKKTLGIDDNAPKDEAMKDLSEIATILDASSVKASVESKQTEENKETEKMDDGTKRVYDKKTMLDQFGNYPVWMNKREINKLKKRRDNFKKKGDKKETKGKGKKTKRLGQKKKK